MSPSYESCISLQFAGFLSTFPAEAVAPITMLHTCHVYGDICPFAQAGMLQQAIAATHMKVVHVPPLGLVLPKPTHLVLYVPGLHLLVVLKSSSSPPLLVLLISCRLQFPRRAQKHSSGATSRQRARDGLQATLRTTQNTAVCALCDILF